MDTLLLPCAIPSKLIFQFYRVTVPYEELLSISKILDGTLYDAMFVVGTATLASYFLSFFFFFWVVGCRRISVELHNGALHAP